jgi:hypothetical protein
MVAELERLAAGPSSAAEIRRALVRRARALGVAPPSYEHVRRLVVTVRIDHDLEAERAAEILTVVANVAVGFEHGSEMVRVARGERRRRH